MKAIIGRTLVHLLLVLFILVLTPGCGDVAGAPTIPPVETFVIPLEDFPSGAGNQSNWYYAAGIVVVWGGIVVTTLAVPVAAFCESFNHDPVQQPDGSWIWSYSVNITGSVYTAELHGQFITEGVHWDVSISKEGVYEDFVWYYGEHNLPATTGFWILKQSPAVPNDFIQIDWSRNISAGTYNITYTNIVPVGPLNAGCYIDFRYTKDIPYDYTCDIYNKGEDNHTFIDFSGSTGEGRVKDFNYVGDYEWHCWNSALINITCP